MLINSLIQMQSIFAPHIMKIVFHKFSLIFQLFLSVHAFLKESEHFNKKKRTNLNSLRYSIACVLPLLKFSLADGRPKSHTHGKVSKRQRFCLIPNNLIIDYSFLNGGFFWYFFTKLNWSSPILIISRRLIEIRNYFFI